MFTGYSPLLLRLSDELVNLFNPADLQYTTLTSDASEQAFGYTGRIYNVDILFPIHRHANDATSAMNLVNAIREKRFAAADYKPLAASTSDAALDIVLQERRRELMCHGTPRWTDLKRLNKESRFAKTITRTFNGETLTLAPDSNRYVFLTTILRLIKTWFKIRGNEEYVLEKILAYCFYFFSVSTEYSFFPIVKALRSIS